MASLCRTSLMRSAVVPRRWQFSGPSAAMNWAHKSTAASTATSSEHASVLPPPSSSSSSSETTRLSTRHPKLVEVPALPIVGSLLAPSWYSGVPELNMRNINSFWREMAERFGPFYSVGIPGTVGNGWKGIVHIVADPREFQKVVRVEGKYPYGVILQQWSLKDWLERKEYSVLGFYSGGAEWKCLRTFLQTDLLSPASSVEYLPAILQGAAIASSKAAAAAKEQSLGCYFNFCAMDMFGRVMFGSSNGISEKDYNAYCTAAVEGLGRALIIKRDPWESLARKLGIRQTAQVKRMYAYLDVVHDIASRRIDTFLKRWEDGTLDTPEQTSYLAKTAARQLARGDMSLKELKERNLLLLLAAVDTTAGKAAWNAMQLALHPEIQQELYGQLQRAVQGAGGSLTVDVLTDRTKVPLLSAVIRETHRCTPAIPMNTYKEIASSSVTVHGVTFPPGSCYLFDSLSPQMDPELVDNPMDFCPERFLPQAVQARKGTAQAVIDHPFFSGPFSQGARKCPGSRVARLEVEALLARLVLDWKIEIESPTGNNGVKKQLPHWSEVNGSFRTVNMPLFPEGLSFKPRAEG